MYQSIYILITTSQGTLTATYPALLAVINNVAAYMEGLSTATCLKIMQLFNSMSSPSFLLANETNHDLLRSLLEAINAVIEHRYQSRLNKKAHLPAYRANEPKRKPRVHVRGGEKPEKVRSSAFLYSGERAGGDREA
jgi:hypothetical protein